MPIEFEKASACCKKSMEDIYEKLKTAEVLEEFLAAAPSIVKPKVSVSKTMFGIIMLLWDLGTRVWSWRKTDPQPIILSPQLFRTG